MQIEPSAEKFAARYEAGEPQVVWTTLVADLETPVSAFLKIAGSRPMSFLLESVEGGAVRGRYSIIGLEPDMVFRANGEHAEVNRAPASSPAAFAPMSEPPLQALRTFIAESRIALPEELPPMAAGVFGYLGYDMVRLIEELPAQAPDPIGIPDAMLVRPTLVIAFDAVKDTITVVSPVRPQAGLSAKAALARAIERLSAVVDALDRPLRRVNPSPYLFFLEFGGFAIAGSSPELMVKARGGTVTIRPIAGTRPRGATPHEDQALEAELLADPKERAEHLMLLDLGRNDVGRVAEIGSVTVTDQFFIERYSQVMHIVSNVEGKLRGDRDALDALAAGFPAGTVSGAPKVRAMQIIDELEKDKRSLYAGCVGYFSAGEEMDTCIVLRTALIKDGTMYVQAGAGIVADSDPEFEQQECINKAKALFRAAEEAKRFASVARRGQ